MILGGADSPGIVEALRQSAKLKLVPTTPDWKNQIVEKKIRAAVEIPLSFQENLGKSNAGTVKIYIYKGELKSELAAKEIEGYLKEYRDSIATQQLQENHLSADLLKPFNVRAENIAPPEKEAGAIMGGIIAYMLIFMCLNGAMHPAIDLTAGEKERGTMETILS